jgi:hypothetical protein
MLADAWSSDANTRKNKEWRKNEPAQTIVINPSFYSKKKHWKFFILSFLISIQFLK